MTEESVSADKKPASDAVSQLRDKADGGNVDAQMALSQIAQGRQRYGHTPIQPSPIEGEGFEWLEHDRFRRRRVAVPAEA